MLLKEVLQKTTGFFTEKGFSSPRLDAELLLAHALKWERIKLYTHYDYPMSEAELTTSRELVKRRSQGEPIAYILGHRDFYKAKFLVAPGVLITRPETETPVEETVSWLKKNNL
jgi:release factor glutamine methyltransferase